MDLRRRDPKTSAARQRIFSVPFPRNPFFTGREDVLAKLAEQLAAGSPSTVGLAITGLGGSGKTQTAIEFAYRHRDDYQAVFFVRAETESEIVDGFAVIAGLLSLPGAKANEPRAAALATRRWLEQNEGWLLILDDVNLPDLLTPFSSGLRRARPRARPRRICGRADPRGRRDIDRCRAPRGTARGDRLRGAAGDPVHRGGAGARDLRLPAA